MTYELDFQNPIHIYFMGIGGISMSGLAQILLSEGFRVSGSDMKASSLTDALIEAGANVYIGQKSENLSCAPDLVVYTSAIRPDNPEWIAMEAAGIPSLSRAQLLGQMMRNYRYPIAVSGTHGKTTTSSMLSEILMVGEQDPTLSIGGILPSIDANFRIGKNDYFVLEACEYTNSFLSFFPRISIILNIEEDHLDFFQDLEDIRSSFHRFARLLPADGALIINGEIDRLDEITSDLACPVITFGTDPEMDYYATDITYDEQAHATFFAHRKGSDEVRRISLGVPGYHNVGNALSVLAACDLLDIPYEQVSKGFEGFHGTERRFQIKGSFNGITVIDDYAHHPTEIRATLKAVAQVPHNRVWTIFQPHTYTRTKAFLTDFADALTGSDEIILADIYAAREKNTIGITSVDLQHAIEALGKRCYYFPSFEEIEAFVKTNCTTGDLLITMGAGNVVNIGESLLSS